MIDTNEYVNFKKITSDVIRRKKEYLKAEPYRNIVINNFLLKESALKISSSYKDVDWVRYKHVNESKFGNDGKNLPKVFIDAINELNSNKFITYLEKLTGIKGLIADLNHETPAVHASKKGGFLNIHTDFTTHPYKSEWKRQLNVIIYFNEKWPDSYEGQLELWDEKVTKCVKKIKPIFNRCVIFNTTDKSFHGHPIPNNCPENVLRKSIALYYYTKQSPSKGNSTNYRPRPKDNFLSALFIRIDRFALHIFHRAKNIFGLKDNLITKIMDKLK